MNPIINEIAQCIDVPLMDCPNIASLIYDYVKIDIIEYLPPSMMISYLEKYNSDSVENIHLIFRNGELQTYNDMGGYEINEHELPDYEGMEDILVPDDEPDVYWVYRKTYQDPYKILYKIFSKKYIEMSSSISIELRGGFKKHLPIRHRYMSIPYSKIRPGIAIDVYRRFFHEMREYLDTITDKEAQNLFL